MTALAGSVILLLCSWAHIYQRSRDLYAKTYVMLFLQGMEQKTVFESLLWEGIFYFKRTVTLMFPIMVFGETYYVSAYQYGFGELGRLILEATLLALPGYSAIYCDLPAADCAGGAVVWARASKKRNCKGNFLPQIKDGIHEKQLIRHRIKPE